MRSKKLTNQDKGNLGEDLTKKMFNLSGTGGSGVGAYDKLDCKNQWIKAETKCTSKDYYQLSIEKFEKWRFQAAQDRRQFFLHLIPEANGKLNWEASLVLITEAYFTGLAPDFTKIAWSHEFVDKYHKVKFGDNEPISLEEEVLESVDRLTPPDHKGIVILRAPYFKELLEKNEN